MSSLALIQPQRVDFDTCQTCAWLDPLPVIGQAAPGGAAPAGGNVGNGTLAIAAVAPGTPLGHRIARVTAVAGGVARFLVADLDDQPIAQGVAGVPLYAGGITLTLTQGATPFAVGDAFALGVLPQAVDLTGLAFDLDARMSPGSATVALAASTADATPTILNGGASGVSAMRVLRPAMARLPVGVYPYAIVATDPVADPQGLAPVPAFYGFLYHAAVAAQLGQA